MGGWRDQGRNTFAAGAHHLALRPAPGPDHVAPGRWGTGPAAATPTGVHPPPKRPGGQALAHTTGSDAQQISGLPDAQRPVQQQHPSTAVRTEARSASGGMDCVKLPARRRDDSSCSRASWPGRRRPPGCPRPRHRRLPGPSPCRCGSRTARRESRSGTPSALEKVEALELCRTPLGSTPWLACPQTLTPRVSPPDPGSCPPCVNGHVEATALRGSRRAATRTAVVVLRTAGDVPGRFAPG